MMSGFAQQRVLDLLPRISRPTLVLRSIVCPTKKSCYKGVPSSYPLLFFCLLNFVWLISVPRYRLSGRGNGKETKWTDTASLRIFAPR